MMTQLMHTLSPRQQSILNRVVDVYIDTAQPVGSQSITSLFTELYNGSYSSATVRQEMGRLEEWGYLTHPHTSAGRVPTDRGYRFYVDHGLKVESVPDLENQVTEDSEDPETLMEHAVKILSDMTKEACVLLAPELPSKKVSKRKLFLQGSSHLVAKPELQNWESLKSLLEIFEQKSELAEWLYQCQEEKGVSIKIGLENQPSALQTCSIVSISYGGNNGKQNRGALAIIGPKRMRYGAAVAFVRQMGSILGRQFERFETYGSF